VGYKKPAHKLSKPKKSPRREGSREKKKKSEGERGKVGGIKPLRLEKFFWWSGKRVCYELVGGGET